jgi:hypothetical protein
VVLVRDRLLALPSRLKLEAPGIAEADLRVLDRLLREDLTELSVPGGGA